MRSEVIELLLLATASALLVVSLYAVWLWLNLWFTRQVLSWMPVITGSNEHSTSQSGSGCGVLLFLLLIIGILSGLFLIVR